MNLLLLLPILFGANSSSHRLSKEENRRLQGYCGKPVVPVRTRRSMHTRLASRSEAPWVAVMESTFNWFPNITMAERETYRQCTGSLISPRHVLTAAHCISGFFQAMCNPDGTLIGGAFPKINVDRFTFKFTETSTLEENGIPNFGDVERGISKIFYSKTYNGFACPGKNQSISVAGDIAVFELTEDIPYSDFIYPACLNDREIQLGEKLKLFGYGANDGSNPLMATVADRLRLYESVVRECTLLIPTSDTLCDHNRYQAACQGDSGSGKVVFDRRGVASVTAVASSALGCYDIFMQQAKGPFKMITGFNINVIPHLHWICAATGICVSQEIEEEVEEYERLGFIGKEVTAWFNTIMPLKNKDIYA